MSGARRITTLGAARSGHSHREDIAPLCLKTQCLGPSLASPHFRVSLIAWESWHRRTAQRTAEGISRTMAGAPGNPTLHRTFWLGLPEQRWRPLTLDKQQQTCGARGLAGVGLSFREICANPELGVSFGISEQQQPVVIGQEMRQRGSGLRWRLPVVFIPASNTRVNLCSKTQNLISLVVKDNEFAAWLLPSVKTKNNKLHPHFKWTSERELFLISRHIISAEYARTESIKSR